MGADQHPPVSLRRCDCFCPRKTTVCGPRIRRGGVLGRAPCRYRRRLEYAAGRDRISHTTEERFLFWRRDLDPEAIPAGWTLGADPSILTSRANYQPYVEGENFRLIIDGFLVSPNVEIVSVEGRDLNFANSDHNPVLMKVRAR